MPAPLLPAPLFDAIGCSSIYLLGGGRPLGAFSIFTAAKMFNQ